jgi:hypothetical protein
MLSSIQNKTAIAWIEENPIDYKLLSSIITERSLPINTVLKEYNEQYNFKYVKKLTSLMDKHTLNYIERVINKYPNTFYNNNIKITDDFVHIKKISYIHMPEIIRKIKNENALLIAENINLSNTIIILNENYHKK